MTTPSTNIFGQLPPSKPLFHYTSMEGLIGIVGKRTLWATNIEYLNDASEFRHGAALIEEILKKKKKNATGHRKDFMEAALSRPHFFAPDDVFVISLTEEGDLLSQWRGYTPNGSGFSIAFDPLELSSAAWSLTQMQMVKCVYGRDDQEMIVSDFIERWADDCKPGVGTGTIHSSVAWLSVHSVFLAASLKDKSFDEEKEWRLIGVCKDKSLMRFRPSRTYLAPFIELKWDIPAQPIKFIRVGPTPNADLSRRAVARLMDASSVPAAVELSSIPYRSW